MLKQRLIFVLLWRDGKFCLSRNFKLQAAGDLPWINRHYNFRVMASAIDELVVLNVTRGDSGSTGAFAAQVAELAHGCFVPLAVGGRIRSESDAALLLRSGADKLVLGTPLVTDPLLVSALARTFGRQCIVASVDYRAAAGGHRVFVECGATPTGFTVAEAVTNAVRLGAGEVLLTSIDRDGTGQGYDLGVLQEAVKRCDVPIIASGGVGKFEHLSLWLSVPGAHAAATANIFNFLGEGLSEARRHVAESGVSLATWESSWVA